MPPAINYRQTFLRHHVPTELDPPAEREGGGFREEILALDSLRHRLRQTFPDAGADIHRLASRRRFFLTMPDAGPWLYLPVCVRPLPAGDRGIPRDERDQYNDLTDLLCSTTKSRRSVLLTARSGAGKSTAMLKAFFDCCVGPDPQLGGHLPCYLRAFGKARRDRSSGHEVILDLVAEASRLQPRPSSNQIEAWLTWSPPLLLFLDLNTADNDLRVVLAEAIVRFQERFEGRHRWVISYRSADRDRTLNYLQQTALFGTYDLRHLEYTDALQYLDNLRRVEDELTNELAPHHSPAASSPAAPAPIGSTALRRLFDRYGSDRDSLISTPLLMHFVSVIGLERAAAAESLAQLYAEVVEDYLDRDYGQLGRATTPYAEVVRHSGLMDAEGRITIKAAMVRVALTILAGGDTRLHRGRLPVETVVDRLLADPNSFRQTKDWRPADPWWHEGRYFRDGDRDKLNEKARHAIGEFSFLRRDGDKIGFLHDSFLYYFAALAIRCKKEPEVELSSLESEAVRIEWCRKAVERMRQAPGTWRQPALFLGGMLTPEEMRALLPPLLTAEPAAGWFGVVSQVVRGRRRPVEQDDVLLHQIERSLRSRISELERYPEALFPHVYNHLSWCEDHTLRCEEPRTPCHSFSCRILRPAMNATGRPWLRAETPMPPLNEEIFRCDSFIESLAVCAPGEFVTGHSDGTVRRWRVEIGQQQVLYKYKEGFGGGHSGMVLSLAVDVRDGSVLSVKSDGLVRHWLPGSDDAQIVDRHGSKVKCLAVDARDGSVLLGGSDGTVRRWRPGAEAQIVYRMPVSPDCMAVDTQEGWVFFGYYQNGGVWRWRPGWDKPQLLYSHEGVFTGVVTECSVYSVAVDVRDGSVISGGFDRAVRRWQPGAEGAQVLYRHDSWVKCVAVDAMDGSVLSGGYDSTVRRWRPDWDNAESAYQHEARICPVTVDMRDGTVISGGEDGIVRRWQPENEQSEMLYQHEGWVKSVAVDVREGSVLSGGDDHTLRRWQPIENKREILYRHTGRVNSVAVDPRDGSVLLGDSDGYVCRWREGDSSAKSLYRHERFVVKYWHGQDVRSVAVAGGNESVVSGGEDGLVRCFSGWSRRERILCGHGRWVYSVAVDVRDGSVISSGYDGIVRRWQPGNEESEILYRHEDWVTSVAVEPFVDGILSGGEMPTYASSGSRSGLSLYF